MNQRSAVLIRYALTGLFLWFGFRQLINPEAWTGFLPEWTGYLPMPAEMMIQLNGWLEIVAAVMMGLGIWTRLAAGVLGIHLIGIAASVGSAIGVRDAVLGLCTLAITLSSPDHWTLDYTLKQSKNTPPS